jgi:hypothetical protein
MIQRSTGETRMECVCVCVCVCVYVYSYIHTHTHTYDTEEYGRDADGVEWLPFWAFRMTDEVPIFI